MAQFKVKPIAVKEYVPLKESLCFSRKRLSRSGIPSLLGLSSVEEKHYTARYAVHVEQPCPQSQSAPTSSAAVKSCLSLTPRTGGMRMACIGD